ncbi:hypothetical protein NE237_010947 [Protea cynaroides]|uniref:GAG-pre-integrase domain-containing protein n=1 Tax=Protea cynaroides TaxID=273540 RepID=A0A9Q0L0C5_9MAGN|nr:hypothetical protein NE237_010947 [Protea cynaroides]
MKAWAESSFQVMDQNVVKLDHFDRTNFSQWKDKLMFMFIAHKITYVLDPNLKDLPESKDDSNQLKDRGGYSKFTEKNIEIISKMNSVNEKKPNSGRKKYSGESSSRGKKRKFQEFSDSNAMKIKTNKSYYHCGKKGYFKRDCRYRKKQKMENVNVVNLVEQENTLVAMISDLHIGMITELNMTAVTKTFDWWYDSGYEMMMKNNDTTKVLGKDTVEISFTFVKKLVLVNVLSVPEIKNNSVSANLLCKKRIKTALEFDKVVFSKNNAFVGKMYSCGSMFILSIINKINNTFVHIVCSSSFCLWHSRLAHVNFGFIQYMSKHDLISYKQ